MALEVLRARAARVDTQLFNTPAKARRVTQYPYMPLPQPDDRIPFAVGPMTIKELRVFLVPFWLMTYPASPLSKQR